MQLIASAVRVSRKSAARKLRHLESCILFSQNAVLYGVKTSRHALAGAKACREHVLVTDAGRGEVFCKSCGIVIADKMEHAEYDRGASQNGPQAQLTMYDMGLNTVMGSNVDSTGRKIPNQGKIKRLRQWDQRAKSAPRTRRLGAAFTFLYGLRSKMAIPENVAEQAAYYYRKALDKKIAKGKSTHSMMLACLYVACRETNTVRSMDELADAGNVRRTELAKALRAAMQNLNLKLAQYDISAFATRFANNLGVKEKTKRDALSIVERSRERRIIDGKNPVAVAAAAVHIAALANNEDLTQKSIVNASKISSVTIRNIAGIIKKSLGI